GGGARQAGAAGGRAAPRASRTPPPPARRASGCRPRARGRQRPTAGLSRTGGGVARAEADLVEVGLAHAEALVDVRHHLDDLVVEAAVGGLGDLGDERGADGLAVLVQDHLAGRGLELQGLEGLAILGLAAGQVTLDRLE